MTLQRAAILLFTLLLLGSFLGELIPHASYEEQFRDAIDAPSSARFWMGTDALGRDRLSRLIYGTRVSLLLAAAAAGLSVLMAMALGAGSALLGKVGSTAVLSVADVFLCVPWFFLLTAARGALPLNTDPLVSVIFTFLLLGVLGWAGPARVISLRTREILSSDFIRFARATGQSRWRLFVHHTAPNLRPIAAAQFWILVPAYIIAEANLGVLGLGVSEPVPSWGALLRELESAASWGSFPIVLPMLLLAGTVGFLQFTVPAERSR